MKNYTKIQNDRIIHFCAANDADAHALAGSSILLYGHVDIVPQYVQPTPAKTLTTLVCTPRSHNEHLPWIQALRDVRTIYTLHNLSDPGLRELKDNFTDGRFNVPATIARAVFNVLLSYGFAPRYT